MASAPERIRELEHTIDQMVASYDAQLEINNLESAAMPNKRAVVQALNVRALRIGPQIDPGVPWTLSESNTPVALALKSGNFGSTDFFAKALGQLA